MKKWIVICISLFITQIMNAQVEVPLQGRRLVSNGIIEKEREISHGKLDNISQGKLYVYLPDSTIHSVGSCIVICPGGGYKIESMQEEGHMMAQWLASQGIVGIVYKYRLPNKQSDILLADAEEVFEVIRKNANTWDIDTTKIGISGFSAGGHLASLIATSLKKDIRPNFSILFYPVIAMDSAITHQGTKSELFKTVPTTKLLQTMSTDKCIDYFTPPTLIFLSDNDKAVSPINSIRFYKQLKKYDIPCAMYIFPIGSHGYGFRQNFAYHETMKQLMLEWLKQRKLL